MWKRSPPAIMLPHGKHELPTFRVVAGEKKMHNDNTTPFPGQQTNLNELRGPAVMNWLKFFQDEKDIWVQNISATQLSMQFEIAPGQSAGVLIPIGPDPVCLTQEVPFESIKKSMDFRRFLNKVPSVMKLMTEDQVSQYYAEKARSLNAYVTDPETGKPVPNIAAAIQHSEMERKALTTRSVGTDQTVVQPNGQVYFSPPKTAQELQGLNQPHMGISPQAAQAAGLQQVPAGMMQQGQQFGTPAGFANAPASLQALQMQAGQSAGPFQAPGPIASGFNPTAQQYGPPQGFVNVGPQGPVMMEEIIHPRILNLCQQVSLQLPENMRMRCEDFLREVKALAPALKLVDLQHIESFGTYKGAKKWAKEMMASRASQDEGIEDNLGQGAV
jgi:hypothetical protein